MHENFRIAVVGLRGMWAHRWLGLATAWAVGAAALAWIMVQPAKYEASARIFANTDSMFMESRKGGRVDDTIAAKKFIDEQIVVYEKKLQEAENRLKEFKIRHAGLTPDQGKDFFARMSETNALLSQARLELREAERAREAFR